MELSKAWTFNLNMWGDKIRWHRRGEKGHRWFVIYEANHQNRYQLECPRWKCEGIILPILAEGYKGNWNTGESYQLPHGSN